MRILKINGNNFNGQLLKSWSISNKLNQISTLKCGILNISNTQKIIDISNIVEGANVELFNDNVKLFSGILKSISKKEYATNILQLDLTVSDNNEIANRRLIALSVKNKTAGWIVENKILPILAEDGVTKGNIENSFLLERVNFNYITCTQALNYLQTCTGLNWSIDKNKKLNFFSKGAEHAPFNLTNKLFYYDFKSTRKYEQYRNIQYFVGGSSNTALQENEELTPAPDGEITEFYTRFAIASKPIIEIYRNNNWELIDSNDIGVKDIEMNKKCYYSYNSRVIQLDLENKLVSGEKIRATYVGLKTIFVICENSDEVSKRANIENSSGKYEKLQKNESVLNNLEASQYAESLINKYGEIEDKITFKTEKKGLEPGQIINVRHDELGINQEFLIESVSINPLGTSSLEYSISALDGIALGGWENYFKSLAEANQINIKPDENVIFIKPVFDNLENKEEDILEIKSQRYIYMGENTIMSDSTYMGVFQRTEVVLDE